MADNVAITAGSGTSIATDDAGAGGHVQLFKLAYSADGVATLVTADGNGLEVQLGVALPAGTNAIGKLAANSGVDIGDVDVTSLPALPTGTNSIGNVGHAVTGIGDDRKVVTTAGTRVTLAASTPAKYVVITAETDNTGLIVVGGTTVVAALATRQGTPLNAGDTISLEIDNLNDVNLDSTVSGDGVSFSYLT